MTDFSADSILVLLDVAPSGVLAKSSAGLLGAASGVGSPVAVIVADNDKLEALAEEAAGLGAAKVLTVETADASALTVPAVDALATAIERVAPEAVLIS